MKEWQLYPRIKTEFINQYPDIAPVLLQLLANRGLKEKDAIEAFLGNTLDPQKTLLIGDNDEYSFYNPFLFKDMERAVELTIAHIKKGNKIIVYGDYDADGVTSSVILSQALKLLKAEVEVYLPDRVGEGYGLNQLAIEQALEQNVKLIITVDNGIRNKEEVEFAQTQGIDVIITDHHVLPPKDELPDCPIINPANTEDTYPWPYLAGVGVAFKFISALLIKSNLSSSQKQAILEKSLDLVAVGTIADMVSLLGENRLLVKRGLSVLNRNKRLGLIELVKMAKINGDKQLKAWNVGWQIAPRLNAASRLGHANSAFALLATEDAVEAKELATELNQRNISRQEITKEIISQVEAQIDANNLPSIIIGLADADQFWNEGVIGLVAGRIADKYYRPTLIITRLVEEAEVDSDAKQLVPKKISFKGSGRSVAELNLIVAIEECADNLDKYGGHPMACGFSIADEGSLLSFQKKISKLVDNKLAGISLIPKLKIEVELDIEKVDLNLAEQISLLAPFGQNNPQPCFSSYNLKIEEVVTMGFDSQHIKMKVSGIWAIAFGAAEKYKDFQVGHHVNLAYHLDVNDFNGRREIQLKIIDIKKYE